MAFFSGKEAGGMRELWRGFQILDHSLFLQVEVHILSRKPAGATRSRGPHWKRLGPSERLEGSRTGVLGCVGSCVPPTSGPGDCAWPHTRGLSRLCLRLCCAPSGAGPRDRQDSSRFDHVAVDSWSLRCIYCRVTTASRASGFKEQRLFLRSLWVGWWFCQRGLTCASVATNSRLAGRGWSRRASGGSPLRFPLVPHTLPWGSRGHVAQQWARGRPQKFTGASESCCLYPVCAGAPGKPVSPMALPESVWED